MAEGLLGGILGEDEEKIELEAPEALAGVEAFAVAVAAKLSGNDPGVARETEEFLRKQSRVLEIQADHLKDEHAVRLATLKGQKREGDLRRSGIRIRIAFQLFMAVIAAFVGAGVVVMVRDAFASRSVVVESFDAPPALAARGATGKVVAAGILDELRRLQSATRADASRRNLTNAWTGEIKLSVPEAGITLGEISRLLKERFGHDVHIDGELVETETGRLALTVRGDRILPMTFAGADNSRDKLTVDAAEYIYRQSQPVLWAYYLNNRQRYKDAIAFSQENYSSVGNEDRPYLLNIWANAVLSTGGTDVAIMRESLALYRAALKLKPDYWVAHNNVINSLWALGDEEGAWKAGQEMLRLAGGRPGRAPETNYQNVDVLVWNLGKWRDAMVADADATGGTGSSVVSDIGVNIADVEIRQHDLAAADLTLKTLKPGVLDPSVETLAHFVQGRLALELGNVTKAAMEMEVFGIGYADPVAATNYPGFNCWIAPAEEAAGRRDRADAVLKSGGPFVDCYRFRADILDGRGDWPGAQKAYGKAVTLAPDLPAPYYSWGLALMRHGDLSGAEAKLKDANQRGLHWADPLKAWGDLLVKQGNPKEALKKYDEALKYAPSWAVLKGAREETAKVKR